MEFEQKARPKSNEQNYHIHNLKIAREFSKKLLEEMGELVRSIVLFGSNTKDTTRKDSDIDIVIVLDNISVFVSAELREAYRIITRNLNATIGEGKVHLLTLNLTDLWDMARKGDPVMINILRTGTPIFDRDLVEPMQYLLEIGKIRPTREAAYNYLSRSKTLYEETQKHMENAMLDLYYAVIDIVHASLMAQKVMPPSPKEMPQLFRKTFRTHAMVKFSEDIDHFYKLAKDIEHKKIGEITGTQYDKERKRADALIKELEKFIKSEIEKTDIFDL